MKRSTFSVGAGAALALCLVGCSPQQSAEVNSVAGQAEQKAQQAAQVVGKAAKDTALAARVKSAMVASGKLDTSGINVDAQGTVVYVRGAVPDAKQKQLAVRIAQDTVDPGTKVVDQLNVRIIVSAGHTAVVSRPGVKPAAKPK